MKALCIVGENPVASDPNAREVIAALKELDFLVVQDIVMTETAKLAHVVLPAASSAEKEETFTNTERRIQQVRRGKLVTRIHCTRKCPPPRVVFIPFHFLRAAANLLTVDDLDTVSKIPAFKVYAVKVEPELEAPKDLSA